MIWDRKWIIVNFGLFYAVGSLFPCSPKVVYVQAAILPGWTNGEIMLFIIPLRLSWSFATIWYETCSWIYVAKLGYLSIRRHWWGFFRGEERVRPMNLLLFNWLHSKDAYVDVTRGSPFLGTRVSSCAPGASLVNVAERKRKKYTANCEKNGYKFNPFAFSAFEELGRRTWPIIKDCIIFFE